MFDVFEPNDLTPQFDSDTVELCGILSKKDGF